MSLEPQLPNEEVFGLAIGEALMAADRRRSGAERFVGLAQHMPIGVADRHEFVKREDDPDFRQDTTRECQQIDAK
jgi:hypothetical protein